MRRLKCRDDALELAAKPERGHRLVVRRREEGDAGYVVEPGVLRSDAWIIESGGNRMCFLDLPIAVHQQISAVAVQHARPAAGHPARVLVGVQTEAPVSH